MYSEIYDKSVRSVSPSPDTSPGIIFTGELVEVVSEEIEVTLVVVSSGAFVVTSVVVDSVVVVAFVVVTVGFVVTGFSVTEGADVPSGSSPK